MIFVGIAIYKESIEKSIIDLIFAMPLLIENLIIYGIAKDFDYDMNYQLILFK